MRRIGKYTLEFQNCPTIISRGSIGGYREAKGPLGGDFDQTFDDTTMGTESWEQAEAKLQTEVLSLALDKARMKAEDVDFVFAGDLLNQCVSSTFGLRDFRIPFLGQYGACSTMAQSLIMAGFMVDSGVSECSAAVTSSHFCSAERQFRLPLEYGGQRPPTSQWTVTGSGCVLVGKYGKVQLKRALVGRVADFGIKDPANMGAAMAPAAAESLSTFFGETGTKPNDYDAVFTGDLGLVGSKLLLDLLSEDNIDLVKVHKDCGLMIYDRNSQDVHSGGSGCGCAASVLCGHILKAMEKGVYKNIIFAATGALMSPTSQQQGESIPGIAHVVQLVTDN